MKSSSSSPNLEFLRPNKKDRHITRENFCLFLLWLLGVTTIISFYLLHTPILFKYSSKQVVNGSNSIITKTEHETDIFEGRWIPELNGPLYTNRSCLTIPESNNCGKYGRKDVDYLNWRWKPYGCKLQSFDAKIFLGIVQGKTLAFLGDSVARNQMESLLCLLSQEETPVDKYKDANNRFRTWYFPSHNFTMKVLWEKFFVMAEERVINGTWTGVYDMHLDKIVNWVEKLHGVDYAIISNGHWFFRPIYLHENGNVIACVYCDAKNIRKVSPGYALQKTFEMALKHISSCKECNGSVTLLRTFSPAHFEGGTWNGGGKCNKTTPYSENQINFGSTEWEFSRNQVEEVEKVKKKIGNTNMRFEVLDVTKAALMRPDGHRDIHWDNQWMKGHSDCVHWCLPGPIDAWNELLMAVIRKGQAALVLDK